MSGAVISSNVTTKVNRAITGATTVSANSYVIACYTPTGAAITANITSGQTLLPIPFTMYYGAGQSVLANINVYCYANGTTSTGTVPYALVSGVEFINSP